MAGKKIPDKLVEQLLRQGFGLTEIKNILAEQKPPVIITRQALSVWRRRRGLEPLNPRYADLIPWRVKDHHARYYQPMMLRHLGRRRAGGELTDREETALNNWLKFLEEEDVVVHYEPDLDEGFFYVPRRKVDTDVIRDPRFK